MQTAKKQNDFPSLAYQHCCRWGVRNRRRVSGFTLVELLVSMTITMLLMLALAQVFAIVGTTVSEGRASLEMAGNLRSVGNRLQQDFDGVTAPVRPWLKSTAGLGYFEIYDGPELDSSYTTASDSRYGDLDDAIAFTARSGATPFSGRIDANLYATGRVESHIAEILWWIQYNDRDSNGTRSVDEGFSIYRRALMVRPDLISLPIRPLNTAGVTNNAPVYTWGTNTPRIVHNTTTGEYVCEYPNTAVGHTVLHEDLTKFFNQNDVSVRLDWSRPSVIRIVIRANSLADLTLRQNRFAHRVILSDRPAGYTLLTSNLAALSPYAAIDRNYPYPLDVNRRSVTSLYRSPKSGANSGEDVVVSNALGFDVQVFDPDARILAGTVEATTPVDPGYAISTLVANIVSNGGTDTLSIGRGAFVDLGYGRRVASTSTTNYQRYWDLSQFSGPMDASSGFAANHFTYCTWAFDYERDNIDQDNDGNGADNQWGRASVDDDGNGTTDDIPERNWPGSDDLIDEGTNGIDDDNTNGVDDIGERETSPPYPVPLRGVRVIIRVQEPDTEQIRQTSVVADFVPE